MRDTGLPKLQKSNSPLFVDDLSPVCHRLLTLSSGFPPSSLLQKHNLARKEVKKSRRSKEPSVRESFHVMFLAGAGNLGPGGKNPRAHALRGLFPVRQGLGRGEGAPAPCCACTEQPAQCLALKAEESQAPAADGSSKKKMIWVLGICGMCPEIFPARFTKGQLNPKHLRSPSGVVAPAPSQAPQPKLLIFVQKHGWKHSPCFSALVLLLPN